MLYGVTIPKPCHEDWDMMTPMEQGRHCMVCNKVVTDFTSMTNQEILNYFRTGKENVCGRIGDEQLQRLQPYIPLPKKAKVFLYALAIAFFTELPLNVFGQEPQKANQATSIQYGEVYGRVTNENGEPLDFATVRALENGIIKGGAKTDENGNFKINYLKPSEYTIRVTYAGYVGEELQGVIVEGKKYQMVNFKLALQSNIIKSSDVKVLGGMRYVEPIKPKITIGNFKTLKLDPSNPGRKGFRKSDIRHMGG